MGSRIRTMSRWAAAAVVAVMAVLQLIPVERGSPPVQSEIVAPEPIRAILRRSCYDCHSHETRWPWYGYVAPLSWWMADHVSHARGDLNFSDWPVLDLELQKMAFRDIEEQIEKGEMPLRSYTLMHWDARLDESEREMLLRWARSGYRERRSTDSFSEPRR